MYPIEYTRLQNPQVTTETDAKKSAFLLLPLISGELHSASCHLIGGFYVEPFSFHFSYKVKCIDNIQFIVTIYITVK